MSIGEWSVRESVVFRIREKSCCVRVLTCDEPCLLVDVSQQVCAGLACKTCNGDTMVAAVMRVCSRDEEQIPMRVE